MGDVGNSGRWRVERLAWAAGIVVALGGGWMAHAVTRPVVGPPLRSAPVEAGQAAAKQESATEVVLGQSEERLAPTEGATTPVTQAAPAAPPSPPGAMADAGTPAARAQSAPSADAAGAAAPAPALDEIVITGTAGAARRREVGNALASAEAAPAQPSVDGLRLFLEGQVAVAGTDEEAIERVLTRWEGAAQTESAWVLVAPAEAARILGRAPLELEGLPWERMEGAVTASGDVLVRTVHPLPDGRRVSLVQGPWDVPQAGATDLADRREILPLRPLAAAPEVAARAESAAPSLGVGRWMGPLIVRLYGPLQMAELVGLAARLR